MRDSIWRALSEDLKANTGGGGTVRGIAALFYNPGFCAVALHRIAARLNSFGKLGQAFGLLVWRLNVILNGCYFNNRAKIAPGLRLPHPIGVVVGADVSIGANVTIYQHVTIGVNENCHALCPTIHADCVIYAGAVIVGAISLGPNAVVGANSFVRINVPEDSLAVGLPAIIKARLRAPIAENGALNTSDRPGGLL
ncbi:MAG: serine acetyltransferase [Methylocella sp.]